MNYSFTTRPPNFPSENHTLSTNKRFMKDEYFIFGTVPDGWSLEFHKDKVLLKQVENGNTTRADFTDFIVGWVEEYKKSH